MYANKQTNINWFVYYFFSSFRLFILWGERESVGIYILIVTFHSIVLLYLVFLCFFFVRPFVCQTRSQFIEGRIVELPLHAKPCLLCERVKCRFAGDLTACVLSLSPTLSLFSLFRKDECSQIQHNTSTVRAKCKCFQPEQWTVCSDTQLFFSNDFTQLWFTL